MNSESLSGILNCALDFRCSIEIQVIKFFYIYLFAEGWHLPTMAHLWRSQDSLQDSVLSYNMGPTDWAQAWKCVVACWIIPLALNYYILVWLVGLSAFENNIFKFCNPVSFCFLCFKTVLLSAYSSGLLWFPDDCFIINSFFLIPRIVLSFFSQSYSYIPPKFFWSLYGITLTLILHFS